MKAIASLYCNQCINLIQKRELFRFDMNLESSSDNNYDKGVAGFERRHLLSYSGHREVSLLASLSTCLTWQKLYIGLL